MTYQVKESCHFVFYLLMQEQLEYCTSTAYKYNGRGRYLFFLMGGKETNDYSALEEKEQAGKRPKPFSWLILFIVHCSTWGFLLQETWFAGCRLMNKALLEPPTQQSSLLVNDGNEHFPRLLPNSLTPRGISAISEGVLL